jgi:hypothetical protein
VPDRANGIACFVAALQPPGLAGIAVTGDVLCLRRDLPGFW